VDWMISTGANLYHDTHFGLGLALHEGTTQVDDRALRGRRRPHLRHLLRLRRAAGHGPVLPGDHHVAGVPASHEHAPSSTTCAASTLTRARRRSARASVASCSVRTARRAGLHEFAGRLEHRHERGGEGARGRASCVRRERGRERDGGIVLQAKRSGGKSACWIMGGGSPKNFLLQTEPQIQEVLGIVEQGHDYFLQVTDARPDTGGLSPARRRPRR
jgi:deoxyhypusine synthase